MKFESFLVAAFCTVVQYYDYHLFTLLAAKISKHFFDSSDPVVQLLRTYMIISIAAVVAKPIGALVLGRIGDIYGRFTTVIISLLGTAVASLVITFTPGYGIFGIYAAIILLLARICTAGLVSSGTDGIRIYIFEKIGNNKKCLGNGMITFFTQIGSFLASLSAWFFTLDIMPEYFWRLAFLLGTILGVVAIYIRLKYDIGNDDDNKSDSKYETYKNQNTLKIVFNNLNIFIPCMLLAGCIGSTYQFIILFFGTYNFDILKLVEHSRMQFYTSIGIVFYMVFSVIGGLVADYFGKYIISIGASIILLFLSTLFGYFISQGAFSLSLYLFMILVLPFITMPGLAFLKQSIPSVIRYRLFSLAHAFGSIIISAQTAYVSTLLYHYTEAPWIPITYFAGTIIIMMSSIYALNRVKHN